jgi:hypothetical protein
MKTNASLGAYGIMYVVRNRKSEVLGLLLKNGVVVPSNASDITIALAVTNLLKVSKSFYLEFTKLLISEDTINAMSVNMSGYTNFTGDAEWCKDSANKTASPNAYKLLCKESSTFDPKAFTTTTTTTPKKTTPAKSTSGDVSWLNQGLDLLQTGFQGYLQLDENKTKRELADASVKISADEVTKKEDLPPKPTALSTGAIVGISLLGVTVVGLVIYLVVKNKNQ